MSCDVCPTERGASYSTLMRKWCIRCCGYWIAPRAYNRKLKHGAYPALRTPPVRATAGILFTKRAANGADLRSAGGVTEVPKIDFLKTILIAAAFFAFLPMPVRAADHETCIVYSNDAVRKATDAANLHCEFSGPVWSTDPSGHMRWCTGANRNQSRMKERTR